MEQVLTKETYNVDLQELGLKIEEDLWEHKFVGEAEKTCLPTRVDIETGTVHIIPVPHCTRVNLSENEMFKREDALKLYAEGGHYILYSLQVIHWTLELEHPIITAGFVGNWNSRLVLFEADTYRIFRNDFVETIKTRIKDSRSKTYKYAPYGGKATYFNK